LLTGLEKPTAGQIFMRGVDVTHVGLASATSATCRSFALYPHYKVYDNIAYPLKLMGVRKARSTQSSARPPTCCKSARCWTSAPTS
jgi:ABC-type sugar transport system ATPase subunit